MTNDVPFRNPWEKPDPADVPAEPKVPAAPVKASQKLPGRAARFGVAMVWRLIRTEFVLAIIVTVVSAGVLAIAVYQMIHHQPIAAIIGANTYIKPGTYLILPVAAELLLAGASAWIGSGVAVQIAWPHGRWDTITPGAGWRALIALCVLPVITTLSLLVLHFLFIVVLPEQLPAIQAFLTFTPHALTVEPVTK